MPERRKVDECIGDAVYKVSTVYDYRSVSSLYICQEIV